MIAGSGGLASGVRQAGDDFSGSLIQGRWKGLYSGGEGARMLESNHLLESNQYYDSTTTKVGVSCEKVGPAPPSGSTAYEFF